MGLEDYIHEAKKSYDKQSLISLLQAETLLQIQSNALDMYERVCKKIAEIIAKGNSFAAGYIDIFPVYIHYSLSSTSIINPEFRHYPRELVIETAQELGFSCDYDSFGKRLFYTDCRSTIDASLFGLRKKYGHTGIVQTFDGWELYKDELVKLLNKDHIHFNVYVANQEDLQNYAYPMDKSKHLLFNQRYYREVNNSFQYAGAVVEYLKPIIEFFYSENQ